MLMSLTNEASNDTPSVRLPGECHLLHTSATLAKAAELLPVFCLYGHMANPGGRLLRLLFRGMVMKVLIKDYMGKTQEKELQEILQSCMDGTDYEQGQLEDMSRTIDKTRGMLALLIDILADKSAFTVEDLVRLSHAGIKKIVA
jgi:hypothetical protein